ncbi:hypothetical protein BLNAU_15646 [Blattamonas nauphoetae]|uniref:Uncharacterized protein n=1 Tax=Blattamonas nauphoetae TaxID=2049346 RepID=A0ABQ9XGY7_9EUKA|nr:hypothetical protein BLNAU_15646 [Blattamonas nauphoetae]
MSRTAQLYFEQCTPGVYTHSTRFDDYFKGKTINVTGFEERERPDQCHRIVHVPLNQTYQMLCKVTVKRHQVTEFNQIHRSKDYELNFSAQATSYNDHILEVTYIPSSQSNQGAKHDYITPQLIESVMNPPPYEQLVEYFNAAWKGKLLRLYGRFSERAPTDAFSPQMLIGRELFVFECVTLQSPSKIPIYVMFDSETFSISQHQSQQHQRLEIEVSLEGLSLNFHYMYLQRVVNTYDTTQIPLNLIV